MRTREEIGKIGLSIVVPAYNEVEGEGFISKHQYTHVCLMYALEGCWYYPDLAVCLSAMGKSNP